MAIKDEMYKMIVQEIDKCIEEGKEKINVDIENAKEVAKMLAELSTKDDQDAESLTKTYIAQIKNICK